MKRPARVALPMLAALLLGVGGASAQVVPQPGDWNAVAGFGTFALTVDSSSAAITQIAYTFQSWQCGGVTRSGGVTVTPGSGWPITDGQFSFQNDLSAIHLSMTIQGSFTSSTTASGSWSGNSYGTTCSGTWTASSGAYPPTVSDSATTVAGGSGHTCAVTSEGAVWCWGSNWGGQLGDGTNTSRLTPVPVSPMLPALDVTAVATGGGHTCAVTREGAVWCWGSNGSGQLGDGTTTSRRTPVAVSGLASGVVAISASDYHTCAVTSAGALWCWGRNVEGQLGDGTTTDRLTPVVVSGLGSGATAIAAGPGHTCAVTSAGALWCWGSNADGQLGDGTTTDALTPVAVKYLGSGVASVATGSQHTCAVTSAGAVWCWGSGTDGRLGDGNGTAALTPVSVSGLLSGVVAVTAGFRHTCALTSAGAVQCWGGNTSEIGDGATGGRQTPVAVSGLGSGVVAIDAGPSHTCAVTSSGAVWCWGENSDGRLGDGTSTTQNTPAPVNGLTSGVAAVAPGNWHSCAVTEAGAVKCWGWNEDGQLGDGTTTWRVTPVPVSGLGSGVTAVSASSEGHTCALTSGGAVWCWGRNWAGELGDGTTTSRSTPVAVIGLGSGVRAVAAGRWHTCALTNAGAVLCWGDNSLGELGDGTTTNRNTPVVVHGLESGVVGIAAGFGHTCALTSAGAVLCWGGNNLGQLGDGTTTDRPTPGAVTGLGSGVAAVAATGGGHTCALTNGGVVWCWGWNDWGQLGDGTTTNALTPVAVSGLGSSVAAISAGWRHSCARTSAGAAWCWGMPWDGRLGDGGIVWPTPLVPVVGLQSGVATIAAGGSQTCAVTSGGTLLCWGINISSLPGDDKPLIRLTPVLVSGFSGAIPTVSSVAPPQGPVAGGTAVTITGTGFGAGATVTIGGVAATNVAVMGATSITATTPAGGAGPADVSVTTPGGTATLAGGFTYLSAPTVTGISPPVGPTSGGTAVTITGTGFASGATVTIGGVAATNIVVGSATSITATTGPHALGSGDIVVTNVDAQAATLAGGFTYRAPSVAARPSRDFDRDMQADVAVYRPASGTWFWLESSALNATYAFRGWGMEAEGDTPVVGDFDGDGVVDPTVFRPASGTWFILKSSSNYTDWTWLGWGVATATPVPGDYDGDRKADVAVYYPSTGWWFVRPSSGASPWSLKFGDTGDVPVPADYDGDGQTDIAVYRPASGTWFMLTSSSGFTSWTYQGWGVQAEGDQPVPGDYDGDGTTDLAVYRPASGTWFILESHAAYTTWRWSGWGNATDVPMPADYDGDGKTDLAVYRPSTGEWWVKPSSGVAPWSVGFGAAGDVPLQGIR